MTERVLLKEGDASFPLSPRKRKSDSAYEPLSPEKKPNTNLQQIVDIPYYYGYCKSANSEFLESNIVLKYFKNLWYKCPPGTEQLSLSQIMEKCRTSNQADDEMGTVARYMVVEKFGTSNIEMSETFVPLKSENLLIIFKRDHRVYPMYVVAEHPLPLIEIGISASTGLVFWLNPAIDRVPFIRRFKRKPYSEISNDEEIARSDPVTDPECPVTVTTAHEVELSVHCIVGKVKMSGKIYHSNLSTPICVIVGRQSFLIKLSDEYLRPEPEIPKTTERYFRTILVNDPTLTEHDFRINAGNILVNRGRSCKKVDGRGRKYVWAYDTNGIEWPLEVDSCFGYVYYTEDRGIRKYTDFRMHFLIERVTLPEYFLKRGYQKMLIVNDPKDEFIEIPSTDDAASV